MRELRQQWGVLPVYKMVDTCAAEFEAETPYFYSTYDQENEAEALPGEKALVIGSGPIRIGQGIEFDYSAVHAAWALQEAGVAAIMANSNPETVSTDFDTSDRLYFEPLDEEGVATSSATRRTTVPAPPSIVQFGGQTAINLALPLARANQPILGSSAEAIDIAEDRSRFEALLQRLRHTAAARRRSPDRRAGAIDGAAHRLSRARPPELRPRRPRDGDRPERARPDPLRRAGGRDRGRKAYPHRQIPRRDRG